MGDTNMYEYNCTIARVVDGDTVDIDIDLGFGLWVRGERVRIHGIDTPESRTRDKVEKKFGLAAKKFVQEMLPKGSKQTLVTEKSGDDSKGNLVAYWANSEFMMQKQTAGDSWEI